MVDIPIVEVRSISRKFDSGGAVVHAVKDVSLAIAPGEFVALVGPSGCGKSTLLTMLGLIERPSSGELLFQAQPMQHAAEAALQVLRRTKLGFVFQAFNLLSTLSVEENVMLPCILNGIREVEARERAHDLLTTLGLQNRLSAMPGTLSGGEMQRVAIARAVSHKPALILADEPTGNLDSAAGESVLELLGELHRKGIPVIMATHSEAAVRHCTRVIRMRDGAVLDEQ